MTPAVPWQPHPGFDPNVLVEVNPDMLDPLAMPDLVDPMDVSIKTEVIDDEPVIHDHDIDNVGFGDTSDLHDENPVITDEPMEDAGDVSSLMISSVTGNVEEEELIQSPHSASSCSLDIDPHPLDPLEGHHQSGQNEMEITNEPIGSNEPSVIGVEPVQDVIVNAPVIESEEAPVIPNSVQDDNVVPAPSFVQENSDPFEDEESRTTVDEANGSLENGDTFDPLTMMDKEDMQDSFSCNTEEGNDPFDTNGTATATDEDDNNDPFATTEPNHNHFGSSQELESNIDDLLQSNPLENGDSVSPTLLDQEANDLLDQLVDFPVPIAASKDVVEEEATGGAPETTNKQC